MGCLSKKTSYFLALFCLPLLFLPKINLVTFGGRETAGIRIDDIVLFSASFFIFWAHIAARSSLSSIEKRLFGVLAFSLFSYVCNRVFAGLGLIHVDANILYAMRIFEYFIFFYIGIYASRHFKINAIIWVLFFVNFSVMVAQKAGLVGNFSNFGYLADNTYRCCGLSAFPSEMGLVLNIIFCFLLVKTDAYTERAKAFFPQGSFLVPAFSAIYPLLLLVIFSLLIAINGSRIALAAQGFVFLLFLIKQFSARSVFYLGALACCVVLVAAREEGGSLSPVTERMENLFSKDNVEIIGDVWTQINTELDPNGNDVVFYDADTQDKSWWMRLHKWAYALKIYTEHPESYLQGIGPGFATAGLDGGLIRIFVEYGIIGFLLFAALFWIIARKSLLLQLTVVVLVVNMIFFDAYLAYKPMSLLFLLAGYAHSQFRDYDLFFSKKTF